MKLTNTIRQAFVLAVMQDVPKIDYTELLNKLVMAKALERLPVAVRKLYADSKTQVFLHLGMVRLYRPKFSHTVPRVPGFGEWGTDLVSGNEKASKEFLAQFDDLMQKAENQEKERAALEEKLRATAASCTTTKTLIELLPEFEKYLPAEREPSRNLPAVSNMIGDLIRAGWPKGAPLKEVPLVKRSAKKQEAVTA